MRYYIKRTVFTVLEALFLMAVLLIGNFMTVRISLTAAGSPRQLFCAVFLFCLFLVFLLRYLWHRFTLWRISHFSIHRIDKMTGVEFEEFLRLRFEQLGFTVEATKASHDYGADLILHKKKTTIAVQVKRYDSSIGVKAVQEVIGSMAYYDADKGLVVTNSVFTRNAEALAEANQVILWDRDVLVRLLAGEPMVGYVSELL
jgi:restriction system protein